MQAVTTIGLDIAVVFQVHGVDAAGELLIRRQVKRCAVLSFFQNCQYARSDRGLRLVAPLVARAPSTGHSVRLMPPAYVKPYLSSSDPR